MNTFRDRKSYPGTVGGPFEVLVTAGNHLERIPTVGFWLILAVVAFTVNKYDWVKGTGLIIIFLFDWLLITSLPRFQISFGPIKPQVFLLAILRSTFVLLPGVWFWIVQFAGMILVIQGFFIEPQILEVTHQELSSSKLPPGTTLRILHFGDLHMSRLRRVDHALLRQVHDLKPDLVLFSGDTLSYSSVDSPVSRDEASAVFRSFEEAPLGMYTVAGSPPVDPPGALDEIYRETSFQLLDDTSTMLKLGDTTVQLIGVSCTHRPHVDGATLRQILEVSQGENFKLLLYHSPDLAPEAAKMGIDLQLSGHTHGGQVRLPFFGAIYTSSLYGKKFEIGRMKLGNMTLFVTKGIGLEGASAPRVRFLCRPEITVWTLKSEDSG